MTEPTEPNRERFEAIVLELADLIHAGHTWDCANPPEECPGVDCGMDRARAALAYLHGAGLVYWGRGVNPMPSRPDEREPFAVRVQAEFWSTTGEQTPEEAAAGIQNYLWIGGALALRAGYPGKTDTPTRTFLDDFTEQQRAQLLPLVRALLDELSPATVAEQPVGMSTLMEMADNMRARLEYDARRGIRTDPHGQWMRLGWDVGHMAGDILRAPSEAVAKVFYSPAWRPTVEELTWFRGGFVMQRKGQRRPVDKG